MTNMQIAGYVLASTLGTTGLAAVTNKTMFSSPPTSTMVADPRMTSAKAMRDNIINQETNLAKRMDRIQGILKKIQETEKPNLSQTQDELKKLCQPLVKSGQEAVTELHQLIEETTMMLRELKHAPEGYRQAANSWKTRAEDYQNPGLKNLTLKYAKDSETLAGVYQSRFDQFSKDLVELEKLVPFIRETQASVLDFMLYIEQNPDYGAINPTERFRNYLELYAKAHANFLNIINDYLKVMRTQIPVIDEPKK